MSKSICISWSAIHFIQSVNVILEKEAQNTDYAIFYDNNNTKAKDQIINSASFLGVKNVSHYACIDAHFFSKLKSYFFFLCKTLHPFQGQTLYLIIPDDRNIYMWLLALIIRPRYLIFIDDGMATLLGKQYSHYKTAASSTFIAQYRPFLNSLRITRSKNVFYYTIFKDLCKKDSPRFRYNSLQKVGKIISSKNQTGGKNENVLSSLSKICFFTGGVTSERGACTMEWEISLCQACKTYFKEIGYQFIYIPKSKTSQEKINLMRFNQIKVIEIDVPMEIFVCQFASKKSAICSLGSTLMQTLPMLNSNIDVYYIRNLNLTSKTEEDINEQEIRSMHYAQLPSIKVLKYDFQNSCISEINSGK